MRHPLLCACVLVAACGPTAQLPARVAPQHYDRRHLVVADESVRGEAGSAYDLIRRLRPEYLASRGPLSILMNVSETPDVYIDGVRRGGIDELRYIPASDLLDVRFYPMSAVPVSVGANHAAGVIVIRTRDR
jgi:hypothetical protein